MDGSEPAERPWLRRSLWQNLAGTVRDLRARGLGQLLTEDSLRLELARALVAEGVDADALAVEQPHPTRPRARIDLVARRPAPGAAIELKWPREPTERNAAWPDALGGVLADLHRLAEHPGDTDRIFVFAEGALFARHLAGVAARTGVSLDADDLLLRPEHLTRLSPTTRRSLPAELLEPLTGRRLHAETIDAELRLVVFHVKSGEQSA